MFDEHMIMTDTLTPSQRSYCMSRVKGKDTSLERIVRTELHKRGFRYRKNVSGLPGKPDLVFVKQKVVVFIDGDFWHGYRFPQWENKLSSFWREKIGKTRERDKKNFAKLRRNGWKVIRIWGHQIKNDLDECVTKIENELRS